eukprot:gene29371-32981_t
MDRSGIAIHATGKDGPPILLLHGFGADRLSWTANVATLEGEGRVLALDLPGHGSSLAAVGGGTVDDLTTAVAAALDGHGTGPMHVVGHSLGGAVALMLAQARPDLVASLALLLLLAEATGAMIAHGGTRRGVGLVALVALVFGSVWQDIDLIRNQRGDPGQAIVAVRARAPSGAVVLLDRESGLAMLRLAAARVHYPITIIETGCPPARFLFVDRFKGETLPVDPLRCGARYHAIAAARARG